MTVFCPDQLRVLYHEGRVLPFIGAGVSMSVEWQERGQKRRGPSWDEMINQAAIILGYEEPELLTFRGSPLQILEYFRSKKGSMQLLINWLHLNLQPSDNDLRKSKIHTALAALGECKTFYTTNYDDFLERSLELNGCSIRRITSERDMGRSDDKTEIVKFHGDFTSPERMVMSEKDYGQRISLDNELDLKLRSDVLGRIILFIGYSFRDQNVSYLFQRTMDTFGPLQDTESGIRAYIFVPEASDFELQLYRQRKMEVIPIHGQDNTSQIAQFLYEMKK